MRRNKDKLRLQTEKTPNRPLRNSRGYREGSDENMQNSRNLGSQQVRSLSGMSNTITRIAQSPPSVLRRSAFVGPGGTCA
jgi:hypothetical protein